MFTTSNFSIVEVDLEFCLHAGRQNGRLTVFETIDIRVGPAAIRRRSPLMPTELKGGDITHTKEDDAGFELDIRLERPFEVVPQVPDRYWLTWEFNAWPEAGVQAEDDRHYFRWTTDRQHQKVFSSLCCPANDEPRNVAFATWDAAGNGPLIVPDQDRAICNVGMCHNDGVPGGAAKFYWRMSQVYEGSYGFVWNYS